jgi:hypothetical protein
VSPAKYNLGFYIPEDDILHSHCRENLRSYTRFRFCLSQSFLRQFVQTGYGNADPPIRRLSADEMVALLTTSVVRWSKLLVTVPEVSGSIPIPGATRIF